MLARVRQLLGVLCGIAVKVPGAVLRLPGAVLGVARAGCRAVGLLRGAVCGAAARSSAAVRERLRALRVRTRRLLRRVRRPARLAFRAVRGVVREGASNVVKATSIGSQPGGSELAGRSGKNDDLLSWILPTWEQKRHLYTLIAMCVVKEVVDTIISNEEGKLSANLTRALESRDSERLLFTLPCLFAMMPVRIVLSLLPKFTVMKLRATIQLSCMKALTKALYSNKEGISRPFYRLQFIEGAKTPEFQLVQDSSEYGDQFVGITMTIANTLTAPLFFQEAIQMNPQRFRFLFALAIGGMFVQVFLYAVCFGDINWVIFEKVNNVRSVLTRVLNNVEAIALFRGGDAEMARVRRVHAGVWDSRMSWVRSFCVYSVLFTVQNFLFALWPILGIMHELLDGRSRVSDIQRFATVMGGSMTRLAGLASLSGSFNAMAVNRGRILLVLQETERIHREAEELRKITATGTASEEFVVSYVNEGQDSSPALELRDVTLRTPPLRASPGHLLVEGLSLRMAVGDSLLIVGDSGTGKSALLFAMSGVWASGKGSIHRCQRSGVLCLPQRPFTFLGSLRQQLLYPNLDRATTTDDELWGILATLNLERHLRGHGLDSTASWADVLSPGQQQRISVARALLAAGTVRLLLLDEVTSALDMHNEQVVYEALLQCRPHCLVSVGHRPSVRRYHKQLLTLTAQESSDGGPLSRHEVSELPPAPPAVKTQAAVAELALAAPGEQPAAAGAGAAAAPAKSEDDRPKWLPEQLPEPYATLLDCFFKVWRPYAQSTGAMQDTKEGLIKAIVPGAGVSIVGLLSFQLGIRFAESLQERDEEEAWRLFWWLLLVTLVPVTISPFATYQGARTYTANAERLRVFLLDAFLAGPSAAYYSARLKGSLHDDNPADILTGVDVDLVVRAWIFCVGCTSSLVGILTATARLFWWSPGMSICLLAPVVFVCIPITVRSVQIVLRHHLDATGHRAAICHNVAHARENSEAVALLDGGPAEQRSLNRIAAKFITSRTSIERVQIDVGIFIGTLSTLVYRVNELVCGRRIVMGASKMSNYYENAAMIGMAFSLVGIAGQLCGEFLMPSFVACRRVRDLMARIRDAKGMQESGGVLLAEPPDERIVLELRCVNLSVIQSARSKQLQQQLLLARVSARLWEGESLLIIGESGLGKSSLLRAIAGISNQGSGQIYCPRKEHVMFFAQRPYLCFGTLREQLLYPNTDWCKVSDRQLCEALKAVDLEHLLASPGLGPTSNTLEETEKALHESQSWTSQLSLGEIQRLGFARLLVREGVRLTLFDEGTSALDLQHEAALYSLLAARTRSYVSVAHRPQLQEWHSHVLVLEQNLQGQALGTSRFSDFVHYRKELEGLGAHRDERSGLRRPLANGGRPRQ